MSEGDSTTAPISDPTPVRRRKFVWLTIALAVVVSLVAGELLARLLGHRPFSARPGQLRVEPVTETGTAATNAAPVPSLFRALEQGGYVHRAGTFNVTLETGYSFRLTHDPNGLRVTRPMDVPVTNRPALWLMGCSLTHGWSVNDGESYPWLVQTALPERDVLNGGTSGYGTLHSRLLFQELLKTRPKPRTVVYAYGLFHDYRNTFIRVWRKGFVPYNRLPDLTYPRACIGPGDTVEYEVVPVAYREWPGQRFSALVHFLEGAYNARESAASQSHRVSRGLVMSWAGFCVKEQIGFVVAGISSDAGPMLDWCRSVKIRAVDISVPLTDPANINAPHDNHPSAKAHREYARKLVEYLKAERNDQGPMSNDQGSSKAQ